MVKESNGESNSQNPCHCGIYILMGETGSSQINIVIIDCVKFSESNSERFEIVIMKIREYSSYHVTVTVVNTLHALSYFILTTT